MRVRERFPLHYIRPTHRDWDRVNLGTDWHAHTKIRMRVRIANLVGVQPTVTIRGVYTDERDDRPINIIKIAGTLYIRDGHHRVTRAIKRKRKTIFAEVLAL